MKKVAIPLVFLFLFFPSIANSQHTIAPEIIGPRESDAKIVLKTDAFLFVPILAVGMTQWSWGNLSFSSSDEGYFQETSRYGGADKAGHFYSSFLIADLLSRKFSMDGIEDDRAAAYGALSAFGLTALVEVGDATSPEHGFSMQDQIMNTLGALTSYVLRINPGLNEKIDVKIDYIPTTNPFSSDGRLLDDYDGMRYILALKLAGFDFARNNFLRFFEIQGSYRARGYIDHEPNRSRELGIGIALNINEIIDYFTGDSTNKYVHGFFEYYQPRYTYVTHDHDLNQ